MRNGANGRQTTRIGRAHTNILKDQQAEFEGHYHSLGELRAQLRIVVYATLLRLQDSRLAVEPSEHTRIGTLMA